MPRRSAAAQGEPGHGQSPEPLARHIIGMTTRVFGRPRLVEPVDAGRDRQSGADPARRRAERRGEAAARREAEDGHTGLEQTEDRPTRRRSRASMPEIPIPIAAAKSDKPSATATRSPANTRPPSPSESRWAAPAVPGREIRRSRRGRIRIRTKPRDPCAQADEPGARSTCHRALLRGPPSRRSPRRPEQRPGPPMTSQTAC